jgi:hypothetical protein
MHEVFKGKKTYYVIPYIANITDRVAAVKEMARILKVKKDKLVLIPVWVQRKVLDKEEGCIVDWMWLENVPDAEEMMAVTRKTEFGV